MDGIAENAAYIVAIMFVLGIPSLVLLGFADTVKDWIVGKNRNGGN